MPQFNFQPIVQQYTPPPVAEFHAFGQELQQRYQNNMAEWDAMDMLMNQMEVQRGTEHLRDQAFMEMRGLIDEFSKEGNWEDASPKLRLAAKRLANDRQLRTAQENYQNARKWNEAANEARAQGQRILQFSDYENARFDEDGNLLSNINMFGNEQRLDPTEAYSSLTDQIAPEVTGTSTGDWGQFGRGLYEQYQTSEQVQRISRERITEAVDRNLEGIIENNNAVNQRYRDLTQLQGMDSDTAKRIIKDEAVAVGMERAFENIQTSVNRNPIGDPFLSDALQRENLEAARESRMIRRMEAQMRAGDGGIGNAVEVARTGRDIHDFGTGQSFRDTLKTAFSSEGNVEELVYQLQDLAKSDDKKVADGARQYATYIDSFKKVYPDSYAEKLNMLFGGTTPEKITIQNELKETANGQRLLRMENNLRKLYRSNIGTSPLEKAWKEKNRTFETFFYTPTYNALADDSNLRQAWNELTKNDIIKNNYTIVKSDSGEQDIDSKNVGDLRISDVAPGGLPGQGTLVRAYDKEGKTYLLRPKEDSQAFNILEIFRKPEYIYETDIANKTGATQAQIKSAIAFINNGQPIDTKTNNDIALGLVPLLVERLNLRDNPAVLNRLNNRFGNSPYDLNVVQELVNEYNAKF